MSEQELKLHVPSKVRSAVSKELTQQPVTRVRLHALYFDTPTRALVKARIALRLRQEGRKWVQTLKMPGDHPLARIELNHPRPGPSLDLTLYEGTPAAQALASLNEPLGVCYETDVKRMLRTVRTRQGQVEIAFDQGSIRAGSIELPISEVEFELVSGRVEAIFTLGQRWQKAFGLIMDARSKSERGDVLSTLNQTLDQIKADTPENIDNINAKAIAKFWGPRGVQPITLNPQMTVAQALTAVTHECLDQIIRNAATLAEVDTAGIMQVGGAEHVHQLRVGIRRLRSAWSLFNGLTTLPPIELREAIKSHFAKLGGSRDIDVLNETILPVLRAAGQPPLVLTHEEDADQVPAHQVVTSNEFQTWILDMVAHTIAPPKTSSPAEKTIGTPTPVVTHGSTTVQIVTSQSAASPLVDASKVEIEKPVKELTLKQALIGKLKKWHKRVLQEGLKFEEIDIEARHELRKRAKRLRYGLQYAESLLPEARLRTYRKQLANVQDILGEMNDLAVARERFVVLRDTQPSAWFACGWITSRLEALTHKAAAEFKELAKAVHFW